MEEVIKRQIHQYNEGQGLSLKEDLIITEHMVQLFINDAYHTTYYCSPDLLEELVLGNLAINGVINAKNDLTITEFSNTCIKVNIPKVIPPKPSLPELNTTITAAQVLALMGEHLDSSPLHKTTGGTHVMSLATVNELIYSCQDIGRHNATDKLYGYCLRHNIDTRDKILLSSGRITNEICFKAVKMGIKIIIARATVSSLAMDLAIANGLTVTGFTRGNRFNIYANPHRITE